MNPLLIFYVSIIIRNKVISNCCLFILNRIISISVIAFTYQHKVYYGKFTVNSRKKYRLIKLQDLCIEFEPWEGLLGW